jgi:addiction module HigA family antidote
MVDFRPTHPGEILLHEFMEPLGITKYALAKATGVPQTRIGEIVRGRRSITADTALRLSKALGLTDIFWVNLQARYDLDVARVALGDQLDHVHRVAASTP